jgi:hypothetical protein
VDHSIGMMTSDDCEVVGMALEALVDLTDDPQKLNDMKDTTAANGKGDKPDGESKYEDAAASHDGEDVPRSWPESTIALSGLLLDAHEARSSAGAAVSAIDDADDDDVATAQHHCAGLLSRSYKIHGPKVYENLSRGAMATLSRVVAAYCATYGNASPDSAFETLGIYTSVLASVCGSLDGCVSCFDAEACAGLVAAADWGVDKNKAVRSAGLQALRNLCLASHRQCGNAEITTPDPSAFVQAHGILGVALRAAQHSNNNLALSGVAMLRQAVGNSAASPAVMSGLLRENVTEGGASAMAWLVSAFQAEELANGNKGQCECARIVCAVVVHVAENTESLVSRVGSGGGGGGGGAAAAEEEGEGGYTHVLGVAAKSIYGCVSLLESFADATVQQEGAKARARLVALGVVSEEAKCASEVVSVGE